MSRSMHAQHMLPSRPASAAAGPAAAACELLHTRTAPHTERDHRTNHERAASMGDLARSGSILTERRSAPAGLPVAGSQRPPLPGGRQLLQSKSARERDSESEPFELAHSMRSRSMCLDDYF